jgi:hypothetical protein
VEAFNTAYPWIVLIFGVFDAFFVLATGVSAAFAMMFLTHDERWLLWDRIWPAAFVLILTTAATVGVLAATRGILQGV